SSSASVGTFTGIGFNTLSTSGYDEGFYTFATTGGSSTFTCTPNASSTFQGIVAMVFHPASLTTLDTSSHSTQSGTSNLFTSAAFSTTAKGLVVVCGEGLFGGSLFEPGFIGPYASGPSAGTQSNGAACESVATPSAQSGITATMGWGAATAGMWGGAVMAFK
ncbi:MAG: hypothetical protein KGJ51_05995, partial [Acidobacteriota bacterium]|nr:hypothetical protein [Acidobacteriota bacterium]